jgi:dihydroorotase
VPFDFVIRGAQVWGEHGPAIGDVAVRDGVIESVGEVRESGREEVDAAGLALIPGLIDTQVHFREPGATHKEDLESGTRSAVCGGVTTIFEMPNTDPPTTTAEALNDKLDRAQGRSWANYAFFVGASGGNVEYLPELEMLPGTPGVKIFVGSSTGSLLVEDDEVLRRVLAAGSRRCSLHSEDEPRLRARGALASNSGVVSEHPYIRDAEAAALATRRILRLSAEVGRPVHILHISTGDEIPLLKAAKADGQPVTAEVTPQHLFFTAPDCYQKLGTLAQMNPPVREAYHGAALWRALDEGVFDVFGSDHAPHTLEEKANPYRGTPGSPSGMPGVQTMLPVLLRYVREGRLSLEKLVTMACEAPAKLFGIKGKGRIAAGFDADLVLLDPTASATLMRSDIQSKCGWSPFEGESLGVFPSHVFVGGQLVARMGKPVDQPRGSVVTFDWK